VVGVTTDSNGAWETRFRVLFEAHYTAVRCYAARRVDVADVDDVVAETFLVAWRRRTAVPAEPRAWLLGVARNVCANRRRSRRRSRALVDRLAAGPLIESDGGPADESPVMEAFSALPAADQEVLALVTWDGLSSKEAGEALGCSHAAVRVRLHRARRRLEGRLGATDAGAPGPGSPWRSSVDVGETQ
jgi:RNA polymerase sigma factor (sigma-70 family)